MKSSHPYQNSQLSLPLKAAPLLIFVHQIPMVFEQFRFMIAAFWLALKNCLQNISFVYMYREKNLITKYVAIISEILNKIAPLPNSELLLLEPSKYWVEYYGLLKEFNNMYTNF